ncbi:ATP12 family chaperone protein [Cognatishimia sp. MH4019]|uniref:ATP12 family chaperone protein n=1 Tax=Cognatishimia sp. MH4019 TaxID=2854030 RepID=UPI001CD69CA8|nr:ATP12 family protein [Cognatishimia sp. MH4019]
MSEWAAKRFWKETTVQPEGTGFSVRLDGRSIKTPAKTALVVPSEALAQAVAGEWDAQGEKINPMSMPVTRSVNAALDKTGRQHADVANMIAEYGTTDLLCYRADSPVELIAAQNAAWDPFLDWAETALSARLKPVSGVMLVAQDADALRNLNARVHQLDAFELTAFHDLVSLSGSLILGFAAIEGHTPPEDLWHISRVDEDWQIAQWGEDEEASALAEAKRLAFLHAYRFYKLMHNEDVALNP